MTVITSETRRIAKLITGRFFVVNAAGEFVTRNDFGKATAFAFSQRGAAVAAARRSGNFIYDKQTGEALGLDGSR